MKLTTAGHSHGKALVGIIEGLPSGTKISKEEINADLRRRQSGYGRGGRMKIESDEIEVLSGVLGGQTDASPLAFLIYNKDYENWKKYTDPFEGDISAVSLTALRPGHADYAGIIKYGFSDARPVLERASARETAVRVAAGNICKQILRALGITVKSEVEKIGGKSCEEEMREAIDEARREGDTLGGKAKITVSGLPVGVGSYVTAEDKLDGRLAGALMSVQSVKAVEVGMGALVADLRGSKVHDEITPSGRTSNNAGGIEGGMTNGEDVVIGVTFKPIPTLMKGLKTVDCVSGQSTVAASERSDVCAVEAAAVVAESVTAFVILDALTRTFGGDKLDELERRIKERNELR